MNNMNASEIYTIPGDTKRKQHKDSIGHSLLVEVSEDSNLIFQVDEYGEYVDIIKLTDNQIEQLKIIFTDKSPKG